jgi:hypothetical protein
LTLRAEVIGFAHQLAEMCSAASAELPVMNQSNMLPVKSMLNARCRDGASRLDGISNRLDDAVAAFEAFIIQNCTGDECGRIYNTLLEHRERLDSQVAKLKPQTPCGTNPQVDQQHEQTV